MSADEDRQLLDLSFLDEEEKRQIEAVLKRSYEEIRKEENRLNKLQEDIDSRNEQVRLCVATTGGRSCPLCDQPFGVIFNTGARCPECFRRICKQCRVPPRATRNYVCSLCDKKSVLRLGRSSTLKYEVATPTEDEDIFGTNLVMKSLKNLQKFNQDFPQSTITRVMTMPPQRGEHKGASSMSGLLRSSKRQSKTDVHSKNATEDPPPHTGKEGMNDTVTSNEVPPTDVLEELLEFPLPTIERRSSVVSAFSTYSGGGEKGDYPITGEVLFGVEYRFGQLLVHVVGARDLAAADKGGSSDPYVKTYLLPDKKKETKRKTKVVKKTLNPTYNETLKYDVPESALLGHTLWLSVWDWDRFGRNQFLGEVRVALKEFDLSTRTERWYPLKEKFLDQEEGLGGELLLSIKAEPIERTPFWTLDVKVKEARQLATWSTGGHCDAFVKCCLLPNVRVVQKTSVVHKATSSAVWNERLTFHQLDAGQLENSMALEVTVWDKNSVRKANDFLGGLRIGPDPTAAMATGQCLSWMDSTAEEADYWSTTLANAGLFVERWLPLRSSMQPRNAAMASRLSSSVLVGSKKGDEVVKEDAPPPPPTASPPPQSTAPVVTVTAVQDSPRQEKHRSRQHEPTPPTQDDAEPPPSLPTLPRSESLSSFSSAFSTYSGGGGKGDYPITGEVLFGVEYRFGQLLVHVVGARDLAAADKGGSSDPYVKTYLLPDKKKETKRKTKVVKKTLNPTYNETLKYDVPESALLGHTLWLSVWDWDRFGRNQFLGEVRVALKEFDLSTRTERWYPLKEKDESHFDDRPHGDVLLGLMYDPRGVVHIHVKQGRGLQLAHSENSDTVNAFAKIYLLPDRSAKGKRKAPVIKNNRNPVWFHKCLYEGVSQTELAADRVLEVTLWDFQRGGTNEFIGGLRLGPLSKATPGGVSKEYIDSSPSESAHWKDMLSNPEKWIERWHSLRPTMDPRETESTASPAHHGMKPAVLSSPRSGHSRKTSSGSADITHGHVQSGPFSGHSRKTSSGSADVTHGHAQSKPFSGHSRKTSSGSADMESGRAQSSPPTVTSVPKHSLLGGHSRKVSSESGKGPSPLTQSEKLSSGVQADVTAPASKQEEVPDIKNVGVVSHQRPSLVHVALGDQGSISFGEPSSATPEPADPPTEGRRGSVEEGGAASMPDPEEEGTGRPLDEEVPVVKEVLKGGSDHTVESTDPSPVEMPAGVKAASPVPVVVVEETEPRPSIEDTPTHHTTEPKGGLTRAESVSSLGSVYSTLPEKGDYSITGEVLFGVEYRSGQLLVHVVGARDLAAADKGGSSDPYVKTYLLPDKKKETKRKTKVVKKTLNPTYNEIIKYDVPESALLGHTLWLSVWDWDRFGRNQFLGEVRVALKEFDLSTRTERWYPLKEKVFGGRASSKDPQAMHNLQATPPVIGQGLTRAESVSSLGSVYSTLPEKEDYSITGEVLFGVEYRSGQLLVHVVGARDLAAADKGGSSDPYVKTYLLPDKKKETKRKTKVVKKTLNPTYNEILKYKVSDSGLEKRTLCLSVWDDKFGRNKFLGQVLVPLSEVDLTQRQDRWMALAEK